MKSITMLPENYLEIYKVDLQNNKKMAAFVNLLAAVITIIMIIPACLAVPLSRTFQMRDGMIACLTKFAVMLVSMVIYIILHELVHGLAMKISGTKKVKYGFTGMYAFAGSDDYYSKGAYIFIALAPVVLLGAVIALIHALVPLEWFWVIYFIQIINLSGAAGDIFVTCKFTRLAKNIFVKDSGVSMIVYSKM